MIFSSDNWSGASDRIITSLAEAARKGGAAYGADPLTKAVEERFSELFERDVAVFMVGSGTVANSLALSAYGRPGGYIVCHEHAHIVVDEAGATSFFGGGITLTGLRGERGKIAAANADAAMLATRGHAPHAGQPIALSLTQLTELGAAYSIDEVKALSQVAKNHGCAVHMDGARFANSVASLNCKPADITWRAGVDVLSFGGTKNGCIAAEAVVFFNPEQTRDVGFQRQRAGQGYSKNWFLAAQLEAYLKDNHWLELAGHANAMAARLAKAIRASSSARLALEPDGNELFVVLKNDADTRLKAAGAMYYPWAADRLSASMQPEDGEIAVRLIASWKTTEAEVDRIAELLR